jgi:ubiquitin carboxyl-terminal hydrolase 9/13
VTVVRTGGGWLLCDDTSTEVLKEADLPRYFGNAPAGSAYVLYYQAADLDRAALGLPPLPSPKAAAASMRPSTSLSGGSDGPALPPGLSADLEDEPRLGPAPYTPLPPVSSVPGPPSLPTVQPTTVPIPSTPAPPLHIAVPPPDPTAVPAPGARTPGLGLIGRLRGEKSTSALAPITVPATPAGSSVAGGALEPPTPTTSAHDGREPGTGLRPKPSTGKGDRDSKGGTWFVKRRSFRASSHAATAGPEPPLPPSPALPHALPPDAYAQTVGHSASPPSAQGITPPTPGTSQKWYRTASHGARPRAPHPGATLAGGAEANLPAAPSISASPAVSASASGSSNGAPPVPGESTSSSITDSGYDSGTIQPSVPAPTPLRQLPPLPGRTSVPPSPIRSRSRKDSASAGLPPPPPVPTYDPTNHASASLEAPPPMLTSASLTSLNGTSGTPPPRPARSPYREPAARESVAASPPLSPPTLHMQPGASYPFPGSHVPPTSRSGLEPERPQEAAGQASPLLEHKHSSQVIANGPRRGLSVDTHKRELPARPSSAGATLGTTPRRAHGADAPPVPPMPARDSQRGQPSPYGVGTDAETPPDERDDALGSMPSSSLSSSSAVPLPTSASAPSPVPPSAFTNGTPKRASRKLSLSGLFGKKDKDKERDRDRERRGTRDDPVLSFTSSMASASSRV